MKDVNKNFIYNVIYQIFVFIIPFIIIPYISRVLGVNNIGIYSYTYSIISYFMLGSMLGINNYGTRTIARSRNNIDEMSKNFFSIYYLQLLLFLIMLILYIGFILIFSPNYMLFQFLQIIFLISVAFDINWFFFGIEKFKITISRNIIIKVLSLIMIFICVKSKNDLWIYILIMSISTLISQLYLWIFLKKEVIYVKVKRSEIFSHLKQCIVLFIPVIAYGIYRIMDKTMIGGLSSTIELGYYENAEKIINIPISFVTALGVVMLPHMSKFSSIEIRKKIISSFELSFCLIIPMAIVLLIISKDFSNVFFGKEFLKSGNIIKFLAPTLIFSAIANVIRANYLIPLQKDSIYVKSTIGGAIINLIFNSIFIIRYGAYGACIGTVLAEFSVMLYQMIAVRKEINFKTVGKVFIKYLISGILMGIVMLIVGLLIKDVTIKLVVQVVSGILVYATMNYKYIFFDFFGMTKNIKKVMGDHHEEI